MEKDTEIQLQMQQSQERIRRKRMQTKKNIQMYMDGKRIGEIEEANLELKPKEQKFNTIRRARKQVSGTLALKLREKEVLSLIIGKKVTNNWLKMHGGIMTRKFKKRKRG